MKTPLDAPPEQVKAETNFTEQGSKTQASVIDTSKMSAGKAAALELAESSRDPLDERGSFASNLFIGKFGFDRIFPWPEQSADERAAGEPFLTRPGPATLAGARPRNLWSTALPPLSAPAPVHAL